MGMSEWVEKGKRVWGRRPSLIEVSPKKDVLDPISFERLRASSPAWTIKRIRDQETQERNYVSVSGAVYYFAII